MSSTCFMISKRYVILFWLDWAYIDRIIVVLILYCLLLFDKKVWYNWLSYILWMDYDQGDEDRELLNIEDNS